MPAAGRATLDFAGVDAGVALCRNLREHILGRGLESEHRHAAIGFLKFTGVDRLLREQGAGATQMALEHIVTTLQSAAAANEVTYLATDIGPDGGKVILSAGAPRRVGHDEDRMIATLRSALDAGGADPARRGRHIRARVLPAITGRPIAGRIR